MWLIREGTVEITIGGTAHRLGPGSLGFIRSNEKHGITNGEQTCFLFRRRGRPYMFGMKEVERPAPVLVAALNHGFDGVTDAAVGFDSCISQIIESAQDVVVPKRREREAEPAFVDDFASSKRAEHAALEQIVFGPLAGLSDGRRFAPCSFVFEQSFEHADGGMERGAPAFGCFAVPATIFELLAQELIGQCVVRFFEITNRCRGFCR
jgi:hypothetical protein